MSKRKKKSAALERGKPKPAAPPFLQLPLWPCLALLCVLFLPYLNSFTADLTFDSHSRVLDDERIREATPENIHRIFTTDYWSPNVLGLYRPLTTLTYMANYTIGDNGGDPFAYHLVNFFLHGLNACLLFLLLRRLTGSMAGAWIGAAFYGLHPVNTEGVTNIVGRADQFAALTILGGLLLYCLSLDQRGGRRLTTLCLLSLLCLLGNLSKESSLALVPVIVLYDLCCRTEWGPVQTWFSISFLREKGIALWNFARRSYAWFVVPTGLVWGWRAWLYSKITVPPFAASDNMMILADVFSWQLTAYRILVHYLWIIVWPARLSVDYSFNQIPLVAFPPASAYDWSGIFSLVLLVGIGLLALGCLPRKPLAAFFILFFFLTLFPASNILIIKASIVGERFLYVPMIGVAGLVALGIVSWQAKVRPRLATRFPNRSLLLQRTALGFLILVLVALGWRTYDRNRDWQTSVALFQAAVDATPMSARNHSALAASLYHQAAASGTLFETLDRILLHSGKACEINTLLPKGQKSILTFTNHAEFLLEKASFLPHEVKKPYLDEAMETMSPFKDILAPLDQRLSDVEPTITARIGTRRARPMTAPRHSVSTMLGRIYLAKQQPEKARPYLARALELHPHAQSSYHWMAQLYLQSQQFEEAAVAFNQSIILGTPETRQSDWKTLIDLYENQLGHPDMVLQVDGQAYFNLDHPLAREHIDQACLGIYRNLLADDQTENAGAFRQTAINQFHCSPALFSETAER